MVKSKVRFDGLDVAAMVSYLKCVALGRRIINIYNGPNGETYLFKLDKNNTNTIVSSTSGSGVATVENASKNSSNDQNEQSSSSSNPAAADESSTNTNTTNQIQQQQQKDVRNMMLLIESGLRFHTTEKPYENPGMPTPFCSKLRKHLRGLRLESIQQLGTKDRVVHFVFGSGDTQRHSLILELYARGNVILLNSKYEILALLRSHEYTTSSTMTTSKNNDKSGKIDDKTVDEAQQQQVQVKVGHVYPVTYATTMSTTTTPKTVPGTDDEKAESAFEDDDSKNAALLSSSNPIEWYQQNVAKEQQEKEAKQQQNEDSTSKQGGSKKKKNKKVAGDDGGGGNITSIWRTLLLKSTSGVSHYGPSLLDHCVLSSGFHNENKLPEDLNEKEWKHLQAILKSEGDLILGALDDGTSKGYILYQPKKQQKKQDEEKGEDEEEQSSPTSVSTFEDKLLLEFQPHLLKQHEQASSSSSSSDSKNGNIQRLTYDTFDRAVDEFFGHIEEQKRLIRAENLQVAAEQRLQKVKSDQQNRVQALLDQQDILKEQAHVVEQNADIVDKAIQVVNSALDSGMDWSQLQDLVHVEQTQNQNPIALLIHKLDLENDSFILRLPTTSSTSTAPETDGGEDNDDTESPQKSNVKTMDISISLKETAFGNASELFAKYRASKVKSQKTLEATTKALQAAEETAKRQLQEAQNRKLHLSQSIQSKRKPLWFEKFSWFVTSDNYLVIAGRDAQQNEQLVKRYLRVGDAYLHADVHGAASCILRAKRIRQQNSTTTDRGNNSKTITLPLSEQALREAGNFTICKSSAWTSRMVTSAWWVESHQVSKTAPTGEYLTVGSFMIRGKKNFLPPSQLEMGLGVLFRLGDDEGIARHKNERRDFAMMAELERQEQEEALDAHDNNSGFQEQRQKQQLQVKKETAQSNATSTNAELPAVLEESAGSSEPTESPPQTGGDDAADVESVPDPTETATTDVEQENDDNGGTANGVSDENGEPDKDTPRGKKKKGLSVKERKLIKKYGSLQAAAVAEEERRKADEQEDFSVASSAVESTSTEQANNAPRKRGKKGRMKKMMQKYKDQDDEDRELAMLALHGGEKTKGKGNIKAPVTTETERKAAEETMALLKKDSAKIAESLPENVRAVLEEIVTVKAADPNSSEETVVRWDKFDGDVLEQLQSFDKDEEKLAAAQRLLSLKLSTRVDNFSASLAGIIRTIRKYGHENMSTGTAGVDEDGKRRTKKEKEAQQSAWKQTLAEEGVVDEDVDEDAIDDTVELGKLTGKPHADDLILNAIPVCAPYQTLSQYAYRVKLTPGNMKRGKAAKQCVDMFLKDGQKSQTIDRNRDLIKKVGDNEWVQAICADVKISAAGASKIVKKQKANNKSKKKK